MHHWLRGDPAQPPPPRERWNGRNHDWALHYLHADVILMPDKWEYPWYASWDLAFQAVVMAEIDPAFAKSQMRLLTLPRTQHPYGAIPAFEWDLNAVNPPLVAWAVWQIGRGRKGPDLPAATDRRPTMIDNARRPGSPHQRRQVRH